MQSSKAYRQSTKYIKKKKDNKDAGESDNVHVKGTMTPLWQGRKNWGVDGRQSQSDKSERLETGSPSARCPDKNQMSALGRTSSARHGAKNFKNPTLSFV